MSSAGVMTLVAVLVTVENIRGNRAWQRAEGAIIARGDSLSLADFEPPLIEDEKNLFQDPVLRELAYGPDAQAQLDAARVKALSPHRIAQYDTDFSAMRDEYRRRHLLTGPAGDDPAQDVLRALESAAPILDALRDAARSRPEGRLEFRSPTAAPRINANILQEVGRLLAYRAKVNVAVGRMDDAVADIVATWRLADGMRTDGKTLHATYRSELLIAAVGPAIHSGCRRHAWTEPQLATLQMFLSGHNAVARLHEAMRVERFWQVSYLDTFDDPVHLPRAWWLIRGWAQQNKITLAERIGETLDAIEPASRRIHLDRLVSVAARGRALAASRSPYTWFARKLSFKYENNLTTFGGVANDTTAILAVLALERHRLARGAYPASLAELAPAYLDRPLHDVLDGKPLGYQAHPGDDYELSHMSNTGYNRVTRRLRDTP